MILKQRIVDFLKRRYQRINERIDNLIPKNDLKNRHLSNCKLIANRNVMLELLPKGGVVAELGVNRGDFSELILRICKPQFLHLVDSWSSERYHLGLRYHVESRFRQELSSGQVVIHQGISTHVVTEFEDFFFDWVYIDTDHSYEVTRSELQAYKSKIKLGGVIAGHDYIQGNWKKGLRYGVIEAVHEFCLVENWELIYVTTELSMHPSFAIRKME